MIIRKADPSTEGGAMPSEALRQVYEVEDLGEGFTPELREVERNIRERVGAR